MKSRTTKAAAPKAAPSAERARHAAVPGRRSTDKYQRILDAAIAVFAQSGYFQARVADVAQRAGVADGTVYLYFQSKEEILRAAIDSAFTAFLDRARRDLAGTKDPRERLRRMAFLHLEMLGANRDLAVVFQTELRQSARLLAQFSHHRLVEYFDLIREVVREGQAAGLFRPALSDKIVANCFFGALDEMVTSWVLSERRYELAGAADAVVEVILRGLESDKGQ